MPFQTWVKQQELRHLSRTSCLWLSLASPVRVRVQRNTESIETNEFIISFINGIVNQDDANHDEGDDATNDNDDNRNDENYFI